MVAVSRIEVNHDGHGSTASDAMILISVVSSNPTSWIPVQLLFMTSYDPYVPLVFAVSSSVSGSCARSGYL